jgi:hypothetical protein
MIGRSDWTNADDAEQGEYNEGGVLPAWLEKTASCCIVVVYHLWFLMQRF